MKPAIIFLLLIISVNGSLAQISMDTTSIAPGVVRVKASVKAITKGAVTLSIIQVKENGQGIVNLLSDGETITVQLSQPDQANLIAGQKVEADLKEKLEVDASQSTYVLISFKKTQR